MKIIISHDVDHLTVWEHKGDLIIPKFWVRSLIEVGLGAISLREFLLRFKDFIFNKWNNIEELLEFNKANNIPATFFFGMNQSLGLSYYPESAQEYIKLVLSKGFDVGVHGIEHKDFEGIKKEFDTFKEISKLNKFGIRMHYLRMDSETLEKLERAGYIFDSTLYEEKNPFKINNMWEFPLHMMDGYILQGKKRWQSLKFQEIMDLTKKRIEALFNKGIRYLTILFHDRYFSEGFRTWKEWYIHTVNFLKSNGFTFVSYREAIDELENTKLR